MPIYFKRAIISTKGVVQLNLWVVVLLKFSVQDNITGTPDKKFVFFFNKIGQNHASIFLLLSGYFTVSSYLWYLYCDIYWSIGNGNCTCYLFLNYNSYEDAPC